MIVPGQQADVPSVIPLVTMHTEFDDLTIAKADGPMEGLTISCPDQDNLMNRVL